MLTRAAFDHSANGHPIDERSLECPRFEPPDCCTDIDGRQDGLSPRRHWWPVRTHIMLGRSRRFEL
jgi:hypothetical protein